MKTIIIPNYDNHIIRGIDYNVKISHEEFCEHIDSKEAEDIVYKIYHTYDMYGDPSDYIDALLKFLTKGFDKSDIYIRHCDTYLRENGSEYIWRVQLHISIQAYPSIIQLVLDRKLKERPYMIGFSGDKDLVLTFNLNYIR